MLSLFPPVVLLQQCIQWIYSRVSFTIYLFYPLMHLCKPASNPYLLWPHSLSRQVVGSCWDGVCAEKPTDPGSHLRGDVLSL